MHSVVRAGGVPARLAVAVTLLAAVVNALEAGETMVGIDGHRVIGLPHDRLRDVLRRPARLAGR